VTDWRDDRDEHGFPVANEDRDGEFFLDDSGILWQCRLVQGLGWVWVSIPRGERGELR
jgi:hypothetical protein